MITKLQLREQKDENNRFTWTTEVNWQETSLSCLYTHIDNQIEGGALIDIASVKAIEFNKERESLTVEIVLDLNDMLEETPDEDEEEE
jgi:hypothetical protein